MSESLTAPAMPDPTYFEGRYPTPDELLRDGGLTGVEYCFVSGKNQREFTKGGWSTIRDLPPITIAGPKGTVETVVVMGRGEPVFGAGQGNGIRKWYVDIEVEEQTGLPSSDTSPVAQQRVNRDASKAGKE